MSDHHHAHNHLPQDTRQTVRRVLWLTLGLNLFVMGLKWIIGALTGSLSLQADALHSFTDSANNVLGLFANRFSSPEPDRDHPYGHQKFEAIGALGIAMFLGIACFEILQGAIAKLFIGQSETNISLNELSWLVLVLGINIFVAFYERNIGRKINSPILLADAKHTMGDIWVTLLVMFGLLGVWQAKVWGLPQFQWLDIILAFPVAALVFYSAWEVLTDNLPWLVDETAIAPEAIHQHVMAIPGVINCHDIASRGLLGRQVFIEMHLITTAEDVTTAHAITEAVEAKLKNIYAPARIMVHVEPRPYISDHIALDGYIDKSSYN
ncbi:cation diffusion facilitator family transporter [[Limnothrix rosea] IAM M-220]|uniref:cation diffusion facilitator family transporter n=1 Tax=[Limnothrix rosea] IAM M-220 TaxID=454133 RepID=UPI000963C9DA|nr:cation diffusion facilitator family transporter [[Limnothrix rosea] IAM M-220]OKH17146.1 cation-efflux pump [[Limnothrix rosea] IAM M-220]